MSPDRWAYELLSVLASADAAQETDDLIQVPRHRRYGVDHGLTTKPGFGVRLRRQAHRSEGGRSTAYETYCMRGGAVSRLQPSTPHRHLIRDPRVARDIMKT